MAYYDWIKALHVISVIAWMAGIFYLPRLFVYHTGAAAARQVRDLQGDGSQAAAVIMNPAMILTWITGLTIVASAAGSSSPGSWRSSLLVIAMSAFHMWLASCRKAFAADRNVRRSGPTASPTRFRRC
ncbi:MAG: CopD family protein [Candidatus Kaistia colombiensis]|nr:MAG: CopD family protein [Kaistia sp.]